MKRVAILFTLLLIVALFSGQGSRVAIAGTLPSVETRAATGITATSGFMNGELLSLGSETPSDVFFYYDNISGNLHAVSIEVFVETLDSPDNFTYEIVDLEPGVPIYYVAYAWTTEGEVWGDEMSFIPGGLAEPDPPTGQAVAGSTATSISLTWTVGAGSTETMVRRKTTPFVGDATNVSEGTLVYKGTDDNYTDTGLSGGTTYYYRLWGWSD